MSLYGIRNYGVTAGDVHIDKLLTNISVAFFPSNLIVDKIAPVVKVAHQSDLYPIWDKGDALRIPDTSRAPKTVANVIESNVSSDSYFARGFGLGAEISAENLANAEGTFGLLSQATEAVKAGLMMDWEVRVAGVLTTSTNMGSSATPTSWTDLVNGDPVSDIRAGQDSVHSTTGFEVNKMILGRAAFRALSSHPQILELIFPHGSGGKFATKEQIGQLFDIPTVLVGNAVKNTGNEGGADSFSNIWGGNCTLLHVTDRPSLLTPTYMYSFRWTPAGFPAPMIVEKTKKMGALEKKVTALETGYFQDEKIVSSELGYLISNVG